MTVAISSRVIWSGELSSSSHERAPVVMILMKSAPRRNCSRVALRISSGPSASRYIPSKWRPPAEVAETIRPQARIRGPGIAPRRIA